MPAAREAAGHISGCNAVHELPAPTGRRNDSRSPEVSVRTCTACCCPTISVDPKFLDAMHCFHSFEDLDMKPLTLKACLRAGSCAAALLAAMAVQAQTPAPVPPAHAAKPHAHKPQHAPAHKAKHGHHPHAAAKHAEPKHSQTDNRYAENALKRCQVFKEEADRQACIGRVQQPQVSGSVAGGGVLRTYNQSVLVPAPAAAPHHAPGHPMPAQPQRP